MSPNTEAGTSSRPAAPSGSASSRSAVTLRFRLALLWILFSAANYGYGISELNALQPILTCHPRDPSSTVLLSTGCIPLSESQFGLVTSLFTLGGLVSSFLISPISKHFGWGRQTCITCSAIAGVVGSSILGVSSTLPGLGLGRFVQGVGSGIGVVMVPIFLNEVSPVALKGSVGVLNQLSIVVGIFVAQAIGASWLGSDERCWRTVPLVSGVLSALQLLGSFTVGLESPGWLEGEGRRKVGGAAADRADEVRALLWSAKELQGWRESRTAPRSTGRDEERQGLLAAESDADEPTREASQVGLSGLFRDPDVRPGAVLVILTQLGQQLSGINAVLYYSVGILGSILPALAGSIGILITLINIAMTFPPMLLIDEHRVGRKNLMVGSALVMAVASALLGAGIVYGMRSLSAICMVLMVAGFSFGLGPVPFVILPELVPSRAVSTTTSLGLTLNWTANFVVGSAFLPLKNWLANFDAGHTGGAVFWIFSASNLATALIVARMYSYRPE
ncbi:general substrate transporter [Moesziomyces antarcticus]|uniref:Related to VPS73 - protein involved in vacuolar protein sorting n=1 Tax=Pseudozyma antarctica TaxID=84753 RepID=A0A5C3FL00_PSEA2|nr:general substrate transporter [Moesziomyces antarcticus]GAK63512.1 general substrate transporter [Moesziomyces antarcticus]SPO44099.1 related to VPS73 - protein involved in vacuolar protein sorting [Moesziomyces antarcticus]